jgi:hypothetical protein
MAWGDGKTENLPYHLVPGWVSKKIADVRRALAALGDAYRAMQPDYEEALRGVAEAGHRLRRALFNDSLPEERGLANAARDWFEELDPVSVTVNTDASLPIPWGVLHENGVPLGSTAGKETLDAIYAGFWAPRFEVAAIYSRMPPLRGRRTPGVAKLLAALNQDMYEQTQELLDADRQRTIAALLERPVGKAYTVEGCRTRWTAVGDNDCVIYYFGHATGEALLFDSSGTRLSVGDFRELFTRNSSAATGATPPMRVLTVLNGCLSASGADSEGFLMATVEAGFYGFVGAEAEVPNRFGLLFGHDLLCALLNDGLSVREAMAGLWAKHRPLGLLYGCYAHPDLTVARHDG